MIGQQITKPWFRAVFAGLLSLVLTLGYVGFLTTPGCAQSGSAVSDNAINYATAEQLYTTTLRTVTSLASSGRLTLAQAERFEQARVVANRLLDQWRAAVQAGEPSSFRAAFESALAELIRIQAEAQGAHQ